MIERLTSVTAAALKGFDVIFDVRSPAEFAEDHVPGAENLPVLSDAERAEIGEIYVRRSKFEARRRGGALIARNIADHLLRRLENAPGGMHPLVYCWRGGQRSNAMALILAEVGWRVTLLEGGYRTYRRFVSQRLYEERPPWAFVRLSGGTGTGKTELLARLARRGVQTLDLENLAAHRGSLFGATGARQPGQKAFESRLLSELDALDPSRPIAVEDESSRIGEVFLPPALFAALREAPRIEITAPLLARGAYVARVYEDIARAPEQLRTAIAALPRHHASDEKARWTELALGGRLAEAACALIAAHYDPSYLKADVDKPPPGARLHLADLSETEQERASAVLADLIEPAGASGASPLRNGPPRLPLSRPER